jgi:hypothetical protein
MFDRVFEAIEVNKQHASQLLHFEGEQIGDVRNDR